MKKTLLTVSVLAAMAGVSQAAVSLTFSAVTGGGNGVLTNLASSTGDVNSTKVWGIIVDTDSNGFNLGNYVAGGSLVGGSANQLSITVEGANVTTDDVLYIASSTMVASNNTTLDGGSVGSLARPTSFLNIPTPNGSVNDQFYLVWFDATTLGGQITAGSKYGAFRLNDFVIPADGAAINFNQLFVGADQVRTADQTFQAAVPEPSAVLLGAVGALGLLRRRRN